MADNQTITGTVTVKAGLFRAGREKELAESATPEELAHLTRMGAISGFNTSVKPEEVQQALGATAQTASPAKSGAGREEGTNAEALVVVPAGQGATNTPTPGGEGAPEELGLEDMSRKQLLAKAQEVGLNVNEMSGSGKDGYVTMEDLIRAIEARQAENAPPME